jgi:hypothetical protein
MSRYLDLLKQADKLEVEWQKQVLELEAQSNPKPSTILAVNQLARQASDLREDARMMTTENGY